MSATTATKRIEQPNLAIGDKLSLGVILDNKKRPVFAGSLHDLNGQGNDKPSIRIVHPSCIGNLELSKGESWEGSISKIELTKRFIRARGKNHKVIYFYVDSLERVEKEIISFLEGKMCQEVVSGTHWISYDSIFATIKMRKMLCDGRIWNISEIYIGSHLVMRKYDSILDEVRFAEEQCQLLHAPFNLSAYKRRLALLTPEQHALLGKPLVSWKEMMAFRADALKIDATPLLTKSSHYQKKQPVMQLGAAA